jgi:SAM-dependent methyltransferase
MIDYRLLVCHDAPYSGRYFFVYDNKRRWVPSGAHMNAYGLKWDILETVTKGYLATYELMAPLPHPALEYNPSMSVSDIHDFIGNQLKGKGIEFGAASSPFPVALDSEVEYADFYDHTKESSPYYNNVYYAEREYVTAKHLTGLETMHTVGNESLDFVIACHVIEHVKNPLLAIEAAWNKLKPGGKLVLLVPHRDLTFDKNRELTTLEHLIMDYKRPLPERDFLHFIDFYEKAFVVPDARQKALAEFNSSFSDIHYHVWNENSFLEMANYFSGNIKPWSNITYYPHLLNDQANEFYFIFEK